MYSFQGEFDSAYFTDLLEDAYSYYDTESVDENKVDDFYHMCKFLHKFYMNYLDLEKIRDTLSGRYLMELNNNV